jgi:hypothetical protein
MFINKFKVPAKIQQLDQNGKPTLFRYSGNIIDADLKEIMELYNTLVEDFDKQVGETEVVFSLKTKDRMFELYEQVVKNEKIAINKGYVPSTDDFIIQLLMNKNISNVATKERFYQIFEDYLGSWVEIKLDIGKKTKIITEELILDLHNRSFEKLLNEIKYDELKSLIAHFLFHSNLSHREDDNLRNSPVVEVW